MSGLRGQFDHDVLQAAFYLDSQGDRYPGESQARPQIPEHFPICLTRYTAKSFHIKRERINAQLKNEHALIQIPTHQPTSYFYLADGASIGDSLLLKVTRRSDVRQIEVAEKTYWKEQRGIDHITELDVTYNRVKSRLYTVTRKTELPTGQYGFYVASGVGLTKADGRICDFGIE